MHVTIHRTNRVSRKVTSELLFRSFQFLLPPISPSLVSAQLVSARRHHDLSGGCSIHALLLPHNPPHIAHSINSFIPCDPRTSTTAAATTRPCYCPRCGCIASTDIWWLERPGPHIPESVRSSWRRFENRDEVRRLVQDKGHCIERT